MRSGGVSILFRRRSSPRPISSVHVCACLGAAVGGPEQAAGRHPPPPPATTTPIRVRVGDVKQWEG